MTKAGCILILIVFIIESFFIFPLLWTIPTFIIMGKINKGCSTKNEKILVAILGIIFGSVLGIIGGAFILSDMNSSDR
ncbi:MAG: hypothetical protein ACRC8P_03650 [Spiroplasma sp.]